MDQQLRPVLELLVAVLATQVVVIGVDPPYVLLHVVGGDESPALLAHGLTPRQPVRLLTLGVARFALQIFPTCCLFPFIRVLFVNIKMIVQEVFNSKD